MPIIGTARKSNKNQGEKIIILKKANYKKNHRPASLSSAVTVP